MKRTHVSSQMAQIVLFFFVVDIVCVIVVYGLLCISFGLASMLLHTYIYLLLGICAFMHVKHIHISSGRDGLSVSTFHAYFHHSRYCDDTNFFTNANRACLFARLFLLCWWRVLYPYKLWLFRLISIAAIPVQRQAKNAENPPTTATATAIAKKREDLKSYERKIHIYVLISMTVYVFMCHTISHTICWANAFQVIFLRRLSASSFDDLIGWHRFCYQIHISVVEIVFNRCLAKNAQWQWLSAFRSNGWTTTTKPTSAQCAHMWCTSII